MAACEENKKFGADCELVCHCPKGDNCSAINGLCSGGSCEYGWFGSGCQIRKYTLAFIIHGYHGNFLYHF